MAKNYEGTRKIVLTRRPAIGLKIYSDDKHRGVVSSVLENTPAAQNGNILPGDVIIKVNDTDVKNAAHDAIIMALKNAGDAVNLTLQRPTEKITATIHRNEGGLGIKVYSDTKFKGVKISCVTMGGAVQQEGTLQVNDVIIGIDDNSVEDATHEEIVDLLKASGQVLKMTVLRPTPFQEELCCQERAWGLQIYSDFNFVGVRVYAILEGGAAVDSAVQIDDCIISIDNKNVAKSNNEEVEAILKKAGDVVMLVVCRPDDPAFDAAMRNDQNLKRKRSSLALTPRLKKAFGFSRKSSKEDVGASKSPARNIPPHKQQQQQQQQQPAGFNDWSRNSEANGSAASIKTTAGAIEPPPSEGAPSMRVDTPATSPQKVDDSSAAAAAPSSAIAAKKKTRPPPLSINPFEKGHKWTLESFQKNLNWIPIVGADLVELIEHDSFPDEDMISVLDVGCGDGTLTAQVQDAGFKVVGIDSCSAMVDAARRHGLECEVKDIYNMDYEQQFNVCFSHATLHWLKKDPAKVLSKINLALKDDGLFIGELGSLGNLAAIRTALYAVLGRRGLDAEAVDPWYFPSEKDYRELLEDNGFEVQLMERVMTPIGLKGEITDFIKAYCGDFFSLVADEETVDKCCVEARECLRGALQNSEGVWVVDWIRIRFIAKKNTESSI